VLLSFIAFVNSVSIAEIKHEMFLDNIRDLRMEPYCPQLPPKCILASELYHLYFYDKRLFIHVFMHVFIDLLLWN